MSVKRKILLGLVSFLALITYNRFTVSSKEPSKEIIDSVIERLPSDVNHLCIVNFGKHSGEESFSNIPMEDKLWSCYLHACLMYIQGDALTNKSLRDRFCLPDTSSSSSSRLIKETISKGLIKVLDSQTAPRYMKYIPAWA